MEAGLMLIFWYGMLHAFGPDHLTVIADFSIGKNRQKTLLITSLFALGHGISLFIFAKILQYTKLSEDILAYGDVISAIVILGMGLYLLWMVSTQRIHLSKHTHDGKEHIHIWFGRSHEHNNVASSSSFSLGLLMGAGGVRGMLITFGALQGGVVDLTMVGVFTAGVIFIFITFGMIIFYINENFLGNIKNVRRAFATAGIASVIVGTNILLT